MNLMCWEAAVIAICFPARASARKCAQVCQLGAAVFTTCPPPACSRCYENLYCSPPCTGRACRSREHSCWQNQVLRKSCYRLSYSTFWKAISLFCAFCATCVITSNYLPLQQCFGKLFGGSGCSSSNGRASHVPLGRSRERAGCASCTGLTGRAVPGCTFPHANTKSIRCSN